MTSREGYFTPTVCVRGGIGKTHLPLWHHFGQTRAVRERHPVFTIIFAVIYPDQHGGFKDLMSIGEVQSMLFKVGFILLLISFKLHERSIAFPRQTRKFGLS